MKINPLKLAIELAEDGFERSDVIDGYLKQVFHDVMQFAEQRPEVMNQCVVLLGTVAVIIGDSREAEEMIADIEAVMV